MDPNRLTGKAQEGLRQAESVATRYRHQQVDNEHLLLALLEQEDGIASRMMEWAGRDRRVAVGVIREVTVLGQAGAPPLGHAPLSE